MKKLHGKYLHKRTQLTFEIKGNELSFMESVESIVKRSNFMEEGELYFQLQTRTYKFTFSNKNSDRLWLSIQSKIDDYSMLGMFHKIPERSIAKRKVKQKLLTS